MHHYPVFIGKDFWYRLTGDKDFYNDMLDAIGSVAIETDFSTEFKDVIQELSSKEEIIRISNHD
jgi:hypothetical protein